MKKLKSKVKLSGSKERGFIIEIMDNYKLSYTLAITSEEAVVLFNLLKKKLGDKPK